MINATNQARYAANMKALNKIIATHHEEEVTIAIHFHLLPLSIE